MDDDDDNDDDVGDDDGDDDHNDGAASLAFLRYSDRARLVASPPRYRLANSYMLSKN